MTKYNDIKRVRDIKTLVHDTRQKLSVNGSMTLATTLFLGLNIFESLQQLKLPTIRKEYFLKIK